MPRLSLEQTNLLRRTRFWAASVIVLSLLFLPTLLHGQPEPAGPQAGTEHSIPAELAPVEPVDTGDLSIWQLLVSGGMFMIPIVMLSLVSAIFIIERAIALRRERVLPDELVSGLGELFDSEEPLDPRKAYQYCQRFPSAAANVVRALLLRVGRPHSEIEHTVAEVSQREAERLHANVRWLILAAAIAPLLGLLGTVWGLIQAFYDSTQLAPGMNKADQLAQGIYVALVTTLSGLIVAIPSAIAAHFFEGRLQALFHRIDELVFHLMPQLEQYEGRLRFHQDDKNPKETNAPPRIKRASSS